VRSVTQTIGAWFDETEHAQVVRMMRLMDPTWEQETFERELREYIVPEVVDAYLSADKESLKRWCGEAVSCGVRFRALEGKLTLCSCRRTMFYGRLWSNTSNKVSSATAKSSTSAKST
jgi:hypothetical protein